MNGAGRVGLAALVVVAGLSGHGVAHAAVEAAPAWPAPTWVQDARGTARLALSDDFNGDSLDHTLWCTRYQHSGGPPLPDATPGCVKFGEFGTLDYLNAEQQRYVDVNRQGQPLHRVGDGMLRLVATATRAGEAAGFESAMIRSRREFRPDARTDYLMVARARLPEVLGTWPAFWISPGVDDQKRTAAPPEIDIMEGALNASSDPRDTLMIGVQPQNWGGVGSAPRRTTTNFAVAAYDGPSARYRPGNSMRKIWIEFAAYWTETDVCFYVDRKKIACHDYRWLDNAGKLAPPGPVMLNLAIGGEWAGADGIDLTGFPTSFDIDYVRVYSFGHALRQPATTGPGTSPNPNPPPSD